ncbi:probable serine/threonine-protein kinase iksA isoform X4 [Epinephelus moara]|uniref:probable serine/threonine-protein kinase iksA isoform X4 n=1 Tax=Epinephelus moara TaxID=300413 RepID=UPI00214E1628|nr:probable serine/threonine-protein kinase iksA isoform X4 [Epinephelus moara]
MMKSVQSAALSLTMMTMMMMMMMMMMMISVSAGPLPPSLNRFESRHHGNNTESHFTRDINTNIITNNDMMNSTLKNTINVSANNAMNNLMNNTTNITTNDTMNDMMNNTMEDRTNITGVSTFVFVLPMEKVVSPVMYSPQCVLPTCLTANLGSSLQSGDETAGGATTDPFGVGKK